MKRIAILLIAASVVSIVQAEQIEGHGDVKVSCEALSRYPTRNRSSGGFYTVNDVEFGVRISDWTPGIVEFLKSSTDECAETQKEAMLQKWKVERRQPYLPTLRSIDTNRDAIKRSIELTFAAAERDRSVKEKERAEANRKASQAACEVSKKFMYYRAENDVIELLDNIRYTKAQQDQERRYAAASGVRNIYVERKNGEALVDLQQMLKMSFASYKSQGGKASSPSAVKNTLDDPCEEFRK